MENFNFTTAEMVSNGIKLAVAGSVIYYFVTRFKGLEERLEEAEKKIKAYEEAMKMQSQLIVQHDFIFSKMVPGYTSPLNQQQQNQTQPPHPQTQPPPQKETYERGQTQRQTKPKPQQRKPSKPKPKPEPEEEDEEIELPGDDYDEELEEELKGLRCEGEVCNLEEAD